jgi:hypothetical protein
MHELFELKRADGMSLLQTIPKDYLEKWSLNIPERLRKLLADVKGVL